MTENSASSRSARATKASASAAVGAPVIDGDSVVIARSFVVSVVDAAAALWSPFAPAVVQAMARRVAAARAKSETVDFIGAASLICSAAAFAPPRARRSRCEKFGHRLAEFGPRDGAHMIARYLDIAPLGEQFG